MISIENVSKSFTKGKNVVDDLNLEVHDGEIFGFLGPNGAGKNNYAANDKWYSQT